jgi:hypothetical protein
MNPHCECPVAGYCKRHQKIKGPIQHAYCRGEGSSKDCGLAYWNAWEQGKAGAKAPTEPHLNPPNFCAEKIGDVYAQRSDVGDMLAAIIKRDTQKEIPCADCRADVEKLNSKTVADCAPMKETIVESIYSRAYSNATVLQKAGIVLDKMLGTGITKTIIGGWFDEAIRTGQDRSVPKKKDGSG